MSFGILRRFLSTAASDPKIILGGNLKAGWRCIRNAAKFIPEFGIYTGFFSPFVILCNHYASGKPRLERVEREAWEEYDRVSRKVFCLDEGEEFCRRAGALNRRRKENSALMLRIEQLKEERKKMQE